MTNGSYKSFRIVAWNVRGLMTPWVLDALAPVTSVDCYIISEFGLPKAFDITQLWSHDAGWAHGARSAIPDEKEGPEMFVPTPHIKTPTLVPALRGYHRALRQWLMTMCVTAYVTAMALDVARVAVPYADGRLKEAVSDHCQMAVDLA